MRTTASFNSSRSLAKKAIWLVLSFQIFAASLANSEEVNPVHGIDANRNGVRDDIDRIIDAQYSEPKQRAAALRLAAAFQQSIMADKSDSAQINAVLEQTLVAMSCVQTAFDAQAHDAVQMLTNATVNNQARNNAFTAYARALRKLISQDELLRRTAPGAAPLCPE